MTGATETEEPRLPRATCAGILAWILDRFDAVSVYDVTDQFGISREDSAQRLRKLCKAGYLERVSPGRDGAETCVAKVKQEWDSRRDKSGRPPHMYMLTDRGIRYGRVCQERSDDPRNPIISALLRFCNELGLSAFRHARGDREPSAEIADLLAVKLSDVPTIVGFHITLGREHWLRDLAITSGKRADVTGCDQWWIVAGAPDVVKEEELKPGWGLYALDGARLVCQVQAERLADKVVSREVFLKIIAEFFTFANPRHQVSDNPVVDNNGR